MVLGKEKGYSEKKLVAAKTGRLKICHDLGGGQ